MDDSELIEAYFVVRGWKFVKESPVLMKEGFWYNPDDIDDRAPGFEQETYTNLPNILDSYSAFKEHVLEVMEGEGWVLNIINYGRRDGESHARWSNFELDKHIEVIVKDRHFIRASVISATRYFEIKEVGK